MAWKWFKPEEVRGLVPLTVQMLDIARDRAQVPFVITSGLRTAKDNAGLSGAVGDSSHLTGHAVDLAVDNDADLQAIVNALLSVGFTRIGLYFKLEGTKLLPRHIHVDDDKTKPQKVIWGLIEQN